MKDAQEKQKSHIQNTIQQNIKQGKATGDDNKLRQAKSRQKKLDNRMGMEKSASGGRFKLNRDLAGVSITLPPAPDLRFPGPLISLEKVTFKYPTPKKSATPAPAILSEIDLTIHTGDRIGLIGLNGCGKSTLVKLLTDTTKPTKGTVNHHPRLRMGYYSQHAVEELQILGISDPELTALALITKDINDTTDGEDKLDEGEIRGLLGALGLPGRTASDVPLRKLSGGQLVRLALARLLWKCPQLLILDEITTHLDFHTVTALSEALSGWNGSVVVVSHDRFLTRRVVEGIKDGDRDEDDDSSDGDDEEESPRRRVVYLLKNGGMKVMGRGVGQFEESLEKRVEKLLVS
jgi:ATPase subunit of ABC transporter with duplicated ATPase domains